MGDSLKRLSAIFDTICDTPKSQTFSFTRSQDFSYILLYLTLYLTPGLRNPILEDQSTMTSESKSVMYKCDVLR